MNWNPAPVQATPSPTSASFAFGYDASNRRISQSTGDNSWWNYPAAAANVSYTANSLNQYTAVGPVSPSYDGNGNLTFDGSFSYGYDAENRLTSASGGALSASYAYDAQGRRKSKTVNGTATVFVTDADNREVLEYDGSNGGILNWYAYGLGRNEVLNQMNGAGRTRATLIPDIQGSIVGSLDAASGALGKTGYQAYGDSSAAAGSFRYTGQRIDPETNGLYYYRARMYAPAWGRFMQVDPIGYAAGNNLYAYANNDPLNLTDPSGKWAGIDDAIAIGAGAVIGVSAQGVADLVTGHLSSWRSYAAAGIGGAAGGEAALYSGGLGSGAAAGAAYSLTNQVLNSGSVNVGQLAFDTGISAATAGIGSRVLPAAASLLSNSLKGDIGEAASVAYNWLQGSTLLGREVSIPGYSAIADSSWQGLSGDFYYVESKFGTSTLTAAQRAAQAGLGDAYRVERWGYDWVGSVGANLGIGAGLGVSAATNRGKSERLK